MLTEIFSMWRVSIYVHFVMVYLSISLSICDTYFIIIIINICDTLLLIVIIIIMVK